MIWWRHAIFYEIYIRSFADSDGDGVGDLNGIRSRLDHLEELQVDALWITPFYTSPMVDHGYDVADPRDVDRTFGDLEDFDALVKDAHRRGMRVTVDLVPNHTSDQHEWFRAALAAAPGSPERARYHFRDGAGPGGAQPPNNWSSAFGPDAWTRVPDGQWYLHLFAAEQPDLNWEHPEVWADLEKTLRFWLDRGVDGFRIDVAHGMAKPAGLPDSTASETELLASDVRDPRFDDDGVHHIHRRIRTVLDDYPDRMVVGEIWVRDNERFGRYVRPDELHLGFNFRLVEAPYDADKLRAAIEQSIEAVRAVGAWPTWTVANHDVSRPVSRYGGGELGLRRARAMALVELALPGTVYLYQGEELGLPDADLPTEALRDPQWLRSGGDRPSRDRYRVPIPWKDGAPGFGFTTGRPWLPMPAEWERLTVERQRRDPGSMLALYRRAVRLRQEHPGLTGDELAWVDAPPGCVAFRRAPSGLTCVLNASAEPVPIPDGEPLLASAELRGGLLPADTTVWLLPRS